MQCWTTLFKLIRVFPFPDSFFLLVTLDEVDEVVGGRVVRWNGVGVGQLGFNGLGQFLAKLNTEIRCNWNFTPRYIKKSILFYKNSSVKLQLNSVITNSSEPAIFVRYNRVICVLKWPICSENLFVIAEFHRT